MSLKGSWEKQRGKATYYTYIEDTQITVGEHYGNGHTDNAGTCTYQEFKEGRFHDLIEKRFGNEILQEMLTIINQSV